MTALVCSSSVIDVPIQPSCKPNALLFLLVLPRMIPNIRKPSSVPVPPGNDL